VFPIRLVAGSSNAMMFGFHDLILRYPHDVPLRTAIPRWAFFNVTAPPDQTYNDTVAMSVGRDPELVASPSSESTLTPLGTMVSVTLTVPGPGPTGPSGADNDGGGKSNTGAIVGGTVGGVGFITLGVVGFLFVKLRKRGGGTRLSSPLPQTREASEYDKAQPTGPVLGPAGTNPTHNPLSNPEDPTSSSPPMRMDEAR